VPGLKLKEAGHLADLVAEFAAGTVKRKRDGATAGPPSAAP
jgi:hypothetical protein